MIIAIITIHVVRSLGRVGAEMTNDRNADRGINRNADRGINRNAERL